MEDCLIELKKIFIIAYDVYGLNPHQILLIKNSITVERCPVTEDELDFECYSVFEFKEIEFIDLGKLLSHKK